MEPQIKPRRNPVVIIFAILAALLVCLTVVCCMAFYAIGRDTSTTPEDASISQGTNIQLTDTLSPPLQEATRTLTVAPSKTASQKIPFTSSPTPFPSSTLTPSPLPADMVTQTAVAANRTQVVVDKSLTATQQALNATATQEMHDATATQRAVNTTATQASRNIIATQRSADITATRQARDTAATQKAVDATATAAIAVSNYSNEVIPHLLDYSAALNKISDLSGEVAGDPYLLFDESWIVDIAIALAQLELAGDKIGNIHPVPPSLRNVNNWLVKIKQETPLLVANYTKGVDNFSEYYLSLAVQNMNNINTYIDNATSEIQKLLKDQ